MKNSVMRRLKPLLLAAAIVLPVLWGTARADAPGPVLVLSADTPEFKAVAEGFKAAFGSPIRVISLEGSDLKVKSVGEELKAAPPTLAVVIGDQAAQMAKWYLADVPVVYCAASRAAKIFPAASKTVGVYHQPSFADQIKSMRQIFPDKTKVGLMVSPENSSFDVGQAKKDAAAAGISLEVAAMASVQDVPVKFRELLPKVQLLWIVTDPVVLSSHSIQFVVINSLPAGVPIFCGDASLARSGATAALIPDPKDVGAKAAAEAKKIIAKTPSRYGSFVFPRGLLLINKKTAGILKFTFPAAAGQAAEVIE